MFNASEIELLFEALDALEGKGGSEMLVSMLMTAGLTKGDQRDEEMNKLKEEHEQKEADRRLLKERIILIKAKLIQMRDKSEAQKIAESWEDDISRRFPQD